MRMGVCVCVSCRVCMCIFVCICIRMPLCACTHMCVVWGEHPRPHSRCLRQRPFGDFSPGTWQFLLHCSGRRGASEPRPQALEGASL